MARTSKPKKETPSQAVARLEKELADAKSQNEIAQKLVHSKDAKIADLERRVDHLVKQSEEHFNDAKNFHAMLYPKDRTTAEKAINTVLSNAKTTEEAIFILARVKDSLEYSIESSITNACDEVAIAEFKRNCAIGIKGKFQKYL